MSAITGYNGALLMTSTPNVAITDQALTDSGDHTTYNSSVAAQRYWDNSVAFVFQTSTDGSTWNTAAPTSVRYVNGQVAFSGAISGTHQARIHSGAYLPYTVLADITQWQFDGEQMFEDVTAMSGVAGGGGGTPFKSFAPTMLQGSFQVTKWWVPESSLAFFNQITNATQLVLSGVEATGNRYEGFCYDKKMSIKLAVEKMTQEVLDFQLTGTIYQV